MSKSFHIINGPNLNLLGIREPEIYGKKTLKDLEQECHERWAKEDIQLVWRQSNHEGELINFIHLTLKEGADGLIINPGAYAHTSLAIYDALRAIKLPKIEVHISNVFKRESERHRLLTAPACEAIMCGPGTIVYNSAVLALQLYHQG